MASILSLLYFSCLFFWFPFALAAPAPVSGLSKRQTDTPVTVVTENTVQESTGPVTETCTITLTPITVDSQPEFQEVQDCTQDPAGSDNNNSPPQSGLPDNSSTDSPTATASSSEVTSVSTTAPSSSPSDVPASPGDASSTPALASGLASPTDVSVIGPGSVDSIPSIAQATGSISLALPVASGSASTVSSAVAPTDVAVLGPSSMPAASLSAAAAVLGSSTATPSASAAAAFAIPGKQIQVLPIGLGVFAGVSVIALIVVGLVTYERTKYRKKFRKDKLAESAAPMGYGGIAER